MKILQNLIYICKFTTFGLVIGFLVLFFMPDSQLQFNWGEVKKAWAFYKAQSDKPVESPFSNTSYSSAVEKAGSSVVSVRAIRKRGIRKARTGAKGDVLVDIYVELGSGVVFNEDGYIVTNYHVVANTDSIMIHFPNGLRKFAKLVGHDALNDVAVLKVDIKTPIAAKIGTSGSVRPGDVVIAIGTPFGLFQNSATVGIVSAIDHGPIDPKIQTDASMNAGNSGGALINTNGEVIGISTAKFTPGKSDNEIGINFAAPIDVVKEVFDEILKNGRVVRNWIGLSAGVINQAGYEELYPGVEYGMGLTVGSTEPGSPAAEAGLQRLDLITHYDGHVITSGDLFRKLFLSTPLGKTVEIEIVRDKKPMKLVLKLAEKPETP